MFTVISSVHFQLLIILFSYSHKGISHNFCFITNSLNHFNTEFLQWKFKTLCSYLCLFIKYVPQISDFFFLMAVCSEENVDKIKKYKPFMLKLLCKVTSYWGFFLVFILLKLNSTFIILKNVFGKVPMVPDIFLAGTSLRIHIVRIHYTGAKVTVALSKNLLQCSCYVTSSSSVAFVDTKNK